MVPGACRRHQPDTTGRRKCAESGDRKRVGSLAHLRALRTTWVRRYRRIQRSRGEDMLACINRVRRWEKSAAKSNAVGGMVGRMEVCGESTTWRIATVPITVKSVRRTGGWYDRRWKYYGGRFLIRINYGEIWQHLCNEVELQAWLWHALSGEDDREMKNRYGKAKYCVSLFRIIKYAGGQITREPRVVKRLSRCGRPVGVQTRYAGVYRGIRCQSSFSASLLKAVLLSYLYLALSFRFAVVFVLRC